MHTWLEGCVSCFSLCLTKSSLRGEGLFWLENHGVRSEKFEVALGYAGLNNLQVGVACVSAPRLSLQRRQIGHYNIPGLEEESSLS